MPDDIPTKVIWRSPSMDASASEVLPDLELAQQLEQRLLDRGCRVKLEPVGPSMESIAAPTSRRGISRG